MATSLSLPDASYMHLDQAPECLRLEPAFDGARIAVRLTCWTQGAQGEQSSAVVIATLLAGPSYNRSGMRPLAGLRSDDLVYNHPTPGPLTMSGHVSAAALREVEEDRAGGELWLALARMRVTMLNGTPPRLYESSGNEMTIKMHGGQWAAELEKVTDASYAEILIPVTSDPQLSIAAGRVRKARALIRGGQCSSAAAELRQALDPVREFYKTLSVNSAAAPKTARQRTEDERFAVYVQSLYSWLTSYIHDDEESIKGCEMDRPAATQALGAVAGLLHRLARDHADASA